MPDEYHEDHRHEHGDAWDEVFNRPDYQDLNDQLQREREAANVHALLRCADKGVPYGTLLYLAGELGVKEQFRKALEAQDAALRG